MLEPKNQNQQPNFSELSTKRSRLGAWVVLGATALISGQPNSARADDPAPNPAPAPTAPVNGGKPFSVDLTPPKPASDELFAKVAQYRAKDRPELPYVLYAVQEVARRHPDIAGKVALVRATVPDRQPHSR